MDGNMQEQIIFTTQPIIDLSILISNKKKIQFNVIRLLNYVKNNITKTQDNLTRISISFLQHLVSHKTAISIMKKLIDKNVFIKKMDCYQKQHLARAYELNTDYLFGINKTIRISSFDYLTKQQHQIMYSKMKDFFSTIKSSNVKISNIKIKQIKSHNEKQTSLLNTKIIDTDWDKNSILLFAKKELEDNTITWQQLMKHDINIKTNRQLRIVHSITSLFNQQTLYVTVGAKGGRLHSPLCNLPKQVWECMIAKPGEQLLSIDLNASQINCFVKVFGKFPEQMQQHLQNGKFYEYINEKMYNNSLSRQNVKRKIFKQMFMGRRKFWKKFAELSRQHQIYAITFYMCLDIMNAEKITMASLLQLQQSQIFNKIYHDNQNCLIRYDQLVFHLKKEQIDNTIQYVKNQFKNYFGYMPAFHIKVNWKKYKKQDVTK